MNNFFTDIPEYINDIIYQLQSAGFEAYIVGGCVRDALLGLSPNDWDVCTSAKPEAVKAVLNGYKVIETGIAHGTVTAVKNGEICEITTFRSDGDYTDHRRPDSVSFSTDIRADLSRRDFTVNAMAYSPCTGIIDLFDGQKDLRDMLLRCVGDAETRFNEDALRIIRALRFSASLGFKIEDETKEAIFSCCHLMDYVARERINHEFRRLLCSDFAAPVICEFASVFERIFSFENISRNADMLPPAPKTISLRFALLFYGTAPQLVRSILKELRSDNKTVNETVFLMENSETDLTADRTAMRRLLASFGREKAELLAEFVFITKNYAEDTRADIRKLIDSTPVITLSELAINGSDLIELGISPGKKIKKLLNAALDGVLDEKCENEKISLIEYLTKELQ